jgi:DNA-binding IclR family transcriptional regulator
MTAFLPPEHQERLLTQLILEPITPYTVRSMQQFSRQLEEISRQGYAFECQESRIGGGCVAAPIFNHTGALIAAISTFWWFSQKPADSFTEFAEMVVAGAQEISQSLGWERK